MGGFSIECPCCSKWFLSRGALINHMQDSHKIAKPGEYLIKINHHVGPAPKPPETET